MPNIVDYVVWRGDVTFSASPFNDIDALILTQLAMINFTGIIPSDISEGYMSLGDASDLYLADKKRESERMSILVPSETYVLLKKIAHTKRFEGIKLTAYVNHIDRVREKQFSALTAKIGDGSTLVVFRGTDDTIVGWKEDFNMSFMPTIPSQIEAVEYLDKVSKKVYGRIRVGGHSKGGNLSVYASAKCAPRAKKRIINIYNYDAPGFSREFFNSPEYKEISDKIKSVVPQSSVVGMLFENDGRYSVVKSAQSGLLQHDAFSWEILGPDFVLLEELTKESRDMTAVMNQWMAKMDIEARRKFVNAIYEILVSTKATTITELNDDKAAILKALKNTDKETKKMVFKTLGLLFDEGGKQLFSYITSSLFKAKKNTNGKEKVKNDKGNGLE